MNRIENLRALLDEQNLDGFFMTHLPNIRYFTGFSGSSAYVLFTKDKNYFITDFRYKDQSSAEVKGYEIVINYNFSDELAKLISDEGLKNIGVEASRMSLASLKNLEEKNPVVKFHAVNERIEKMTMAKTPEEIASLKKAVEISDKTFSKMLEFIKPGMKELDVAAEITYTHMKFGAQKNSFDPIVASGKRGALPHGLASDKKIEKGDMVTLDFGCIYNGFCSDVTRTVAVGEPSDEMKKIYQIVLDSQLLAIKNAKSDSSSKALDAVARDYITSKGYGDNFGHGLGHGLGIEVHEAPAVSMRNDSQLVSNSIITIEPGIYVENLGGVRIEDDVLIVNGSCEVLNKSPKELIIL